MSNPLPLAQSLSKLSHVALHESDSVPSNNLKFENEGVKLMKGFPAEKTENFKHVIYNLLVESYNSNSASHCLVLPCTLNVSGMDRHGFKFNESLDPDKKLPELYALHIRHARLDLQDQDSVFIQDLYKFYLRYALELLGKYFEKAPGNSGNKYTFLYDCDNPLFIAGEPLRVAEKRIRDMKTRARKRDSGGKASTAKRRRVPVAEQSSFDSE